MASMLRSGKFIRYFASLTRSFVLNPLRENEGNFIQNSQCICGSLTQAYGTTAPKIDQSLDKSLKRLDQDVRRTGRISRRDIEEVLDEIRNQRSATSSQSLMVIRCCGNLVPEELPEVRTNLVQEIWKTLNTLNVPMDISHYNALLRVYLENEHPFSPTDFLTDLEAKGIEPNRVTYQRLIARYCQQGDIEGATKILEYMREKELPVNENVFNALILGHSQADDMKSAAGIIAVMKQAGLEPSADTFTTLLCCYARHGDMEGVQRTLEECDKNEVFLLDKDFLDVVYSLTVNGHADKVDDLILKIKKSTGYNQDAVNVILRLVNKGHEEVGFKLLKTMTRATRDDGTMVDTGNFFIRQLVKAGRPVECILKFCKELESEGLNPKATLIAAETSLTNGVPHTALSLLRQLRESGKPVRQHFFWPLICSVESNQIMDILRKMQEEFDMAPTNETVRDYVLPNLKENNLDKAVLALRTVGVAASNASTATAYHALQLNQLKTAAEIASNYRAYYAPGVFRKPLINALVKTRDFDSYLKFVRQVYDNLPRLNTLTSNQNEEAETNAAEEHVNQKEVLGQIVLDITYQFKRDRVEALEKVLTGLLDQGLSMSNRYAERIQDRLGAEMTTKISELLGKLSSGELEPTPIEKSDRPRRSGLESLSPSEIENLIQHAEAKNENVNGLKRQLLSSCLKSKDIAKTEEVINRLENDNFVFTSGVYAQIIDFYCINEKLDPALSTYEKVKAKEPDFVLDNLKTIKVANLLIKADRIDDAVNFLEKNKKDEIQDETGFDYKTTCWRLLNSLAESGKSVELQRIFDTLLNNNYIETNNVILGPLIKVHLVNDDLKKAVDTFETICNNYQATPWKNELSCRLIQAEDAANLQRITDLSTNIHGEVNSLYDLVFSFVDCGRVRQARRILETPGLRSRPQRINNACERYFQEGMVQSLEGLVEATKDLNHIDRGEIFYNLLLSYCKEDNPEKALGLWTKMQEEDIAPSDVFLVKLGEYLKSKNVEVPFVMPVEKAEIAQESKSSTKIAPTSSAPISESNNLIQIFRKTLRKGDIEAGLNTIRNLPADVNLSVSDQSMLIEGLVKGGRITEATKYVTEMLAKNTHPIPRIFKFYLNKVSARGDFSTVEDIGKQLSPELKKIISFDNRLCHSYVQAGKVDTYFKMLEDDLNEATTEEQLKVATEKFPRGGALGILEKHPEMIGKFEELAEKYASRGVVAPMNVLWIHHFSNNNDKESQQIWEKHLNSLPRLMFQRIMQVAKDNNDEKMLQKLISVLKSGKVTEGALGNAYSGLLDVLVTQEKFDESLNVLEAAIKDTCLENINKTALQRIKTGLEASGKSFPYTIPVGRARDDTSSSSSSSSSSDEDVPSKKATQN